MKSKLFSLTIALVALSKIASAEAIKCKTPNPLVYSTESYSAPIDNNPSIKDQSHAVSIEKDKPKPEKKKRHLAGKIIIGLGIAWGIVVMVFVLSYTGKQH